MERTDQVLRGAMSRRKFATVAVAALAFSAAPRLAGAANDESVNYAANPWPVTVPDKNEAALGFVTSDDADLFVKISQILDTPDDLLKPGGIAVSPSGKAYVLATGNNRIDIYAGNGAYLESWGDSGTGPGEFSFHGDGWNYGDIAIANDGSIYVADPGNHRVQIFDKDQNFLTSVEGWMRSNGREFDAGWTLNPAGLAIDEANDRFYIADAKSGTVKVYRLDGVFLQEWARDGKGSGIKFTSLFNVTVGADGMVWAPDFATSMIYQYSPDGESLGSMGGHGQNPGQFMGIAGVSTDADGNLYVCDYLNEVVKVISPDRKIIGLIGEGTGRPAAVAVQSPGIVWVAYEDTNSIARYTTFDMPPGRSLMQ